MAKENETIQKNDKALAKKKNKKPNIFVRIWSKLKEAFSEIKKVTWPTWGKVVKQTLVVLAVVLIFLVVIGAIDFGFSALFNLVTSIGA